MPIYEYVCQDCKTPFEKLVLRRGEAVECPSCGSNKSLVQFSIFRARTGPGSSGSAPASGGACGCTPSGCGCH